MERYFDGDSLPPERRGGVIALGNFDGFHLGHQAVVARAIDEARTAGRAALVLTFCPHPVRFFRPDAPPFTLTTLQQKLELFAASGVDAAIVKRFDGAFAAESPESFAARWLVETWGAATVVTGQNFSFGRDRRGGFATLAALGRALGFDYVPVEPVASGGMTVASSAVRELLRAGRCREAARLLSRPFTIAGRVEQGDKVGRILGFPTANLTLGDYLRPRYGVYAVRVQLPSGERRDGVANLGVRPMFEPPKELLEVHLFDFSGDLYGEEVTVELVDFLRPEWRLDGMDALRRQIAADCDAARAKLSLVTA